MLVCIVFSVFTVTPSKIEMQTSQYRKSRIWEIKRKINIAKASSRIRSVRFTKNLESFVRRRLVGVPLGAQLNMAAEN